MVFTDSPSTNFPKSQADLNDRLEKIKQMIENTQNDPRINIHFNEAVFKLLHDCNLITQANVNFLVNCQTFRNSQKFSEGVLRPTSIYSDTLGDDNTYVRFYNARQIALKFNNQLYLISKEWYPDNKREFYNWLKEKAQAAFDNKRKLQTAYDNLDDIEFDWANLNLDDTSGSKAPTENIEDEQHVLISVKDLNDLIESVKILNDKVDNLTAQVKDLKDMWK